MRRGYLSCEVELVVLVAVQWVAHFSWEDGARVAGASAGEPSEPACGCKSDDQQDQEQQDGRSYHSAYLPVSHKKGAFAVIFIFELSLDFVYLFLV